MCAARQKAWREPGPSPSQLRNSLLRSSQLPNSLLPNSLLLKRASSMPIATRRQVGDA
jgi:hypothetical protein